MSELDDNNQDRPAVLNLKPKFADRGTLLLALALFAAVAVTAYACMLFPRGGGHIAPLWLANAWLLAALVRTPMSRWPVLAVAAFAGNLAAVAAFMAHLPAGLLASMLPGDPTVLGVSIVVCNVLESVVGAWIVRRCVGELFDIGQIGHLMVLAAAAMASSLLSAVAVVFALGLGDHANLRDLGAQVEAEVLGLLTLTPSLLVLTQRPRTPVAWRESWTLAVLAIVTIIVFYNMSHSPVLFIIMAALTLPTWRMGLPGAVAGFAIVAGVGVFFVLTGDSPINAASSGTDRIIGLQIFLTVSFFTSVPVAVAKDAGEDLKARLRAALTEAEEASAVKTEFLANMSHELRTPLTSVVGFTHLAAEQPDLTPLTRGYIERVSDASKALLCAVNDILDFSKLEAGEVHFRPESVAVNELTQTALGLFAPQAAAKDLALVLDDTTPEGLAVNLDPDRMRQVLLNLVGNAVKFTAEGQVTLKAAYDEAAETLTFEVVDTGPGIPANRLDSLFKRFSQVDGALNRGHSGTGLGLAICKGIVEAMGGKIGAQSVAGAGSRFFLSVPAPRAQTVTTAPAIEAQPLGRANLRVLVTDDHATNRELVRLFLASIGAEITEAVDGEAAVALAQSQAFDVILMDLRMPKLDGFGAVRRIRAVGGVNHATPILAFTADAERIAHGDLQSAGFDGAVAKPVNPGQLIAAIFAAVAPIDAGVEIGAAVA